MISKTIATAAVSLMALTQSSYVQAEELKPYFIQTFDDTSLVSSEQAATDYAPP